MIIRIDFPFIERSETSNRKNGQNAFVIKKQRDSLKKKAKLYIELAMRYSRIERNLYWGCIMNRYWFFKQKRPRDYDNFCAGTKYYTDSLVDCGLIKNDSNRHIMIGDIFHFEGYPEEKLVYALELIETEKEFKIIHDSKRKLILSGV